MSDTNKDGDTKKNGGMLKKIIPWLAIGAGLIIVALVAFNMWRGNTRLGAEVSSGRPPAPFANPQYGTPTASGIPWYSQYQSGHPPTEAVRAVQADPTPYGLTYEGAIPPAPVNICPDGNCDPYPILCGDNAACGGSYGCLDSSSVNYNPDAKCPCINCCIPKTYGCLRRDNPMFNPWANAHDERFCTNIMAVPGCTDRNAINYSSGADIDNGSCVSRNIGCTDPNAFNYDMSANAPCDACCVPKVGGCTDMNAPNYTVDANINDGSCIYSTANKVMPVVLQAPAVTCPQAPLNSGCAATYQDPLLGGFKECGNAWDLRNNNIGATLY